MTSKDKTHECMTIEILGNTERKKELDQQPRLQTRFQLNLYSAATLLIPASNLNIFPLTDSKGNGTHMEESRNSKEYRESGQKRGAEREDESKNEATKKRRKREPGGRWSVHVPLISNETEVHSLISSPLFPPLLWLIRSFLHACFLSVSPSFHSVFLSNVRPREKGG